MTGAETLTWAAGWAFCGGGASSFTEAALALFALKHAAFLVGGGLL